MGLTKPFAWLHTRYILNAMGRRNAKARYKAYMQGDSDDALAAFYKSCVRSRRPSRGTRPSGSP